MSCGANALKGAGDEISVDESHSSHHVGIWEYSSIWSGQKQLQITSKLQNLTSSDECFIQ